MSVENINKVPKSQWKKWSPQARRVFNYVYDLMLNDQELFLHPEALIQTDKHWTTTSWNAAWTAADAVMTQ